MRTFNLYIKYILACGDGYEYTVNLLIQIKMTTVM
jgi:hypothetical protein